MYHCSTKWATFLMSLKQLRRDGYGRARAGRRTDQQLALSVRPRSPTEGDFAGDGASRSCRLLRP